MTVAARVAFSWGAIGLVFAVAGCAAARTKSEEIVAAGVDHLEMALSADLEIDGVGKDTLLLRGSVAVHRGGSLGESGSATTGIVSGFSLVGTSPVFGEVYAAQRPDAGSSCEFRLAAPATYEGRLEIQAWFWIPKLGRMYSTSKPLRMEIVSPSLPPVGQVTKTSEEDVALWELAGDTEEEAGDLRNAFAEIGERVTLP